MHEYYCGHINTNQISATSEIHIFAMVQTWCADLDLTVWRPFSPVSTVVTTNSKFCDGASHSHCTHTAAASCKLRRPDTIYDIFISLCTPMKEAWPQWSIGHPAMRQ